MLFPFLILHCHWHFVTCDSHLDNLKGREYRRHSCNVLGLNMLKHLTNVLTGKIRLCTFRDMFHFSNLYFSRNGKFGVNWWHVCYNLGPAMSETITYYIRTYFHISWPVSIISQNGVLTPNLPAIEQEPQSLLLSPLFLLLLLILLLPPLAARSRALRATLSCTAAILATTCRSSLWNNNINVVILCSKFHKDLQWDNFSDSESCLWEWL